MSRMDDYIKRQSVIDAIHKSIFDFFDICDDDEESPMTYKDEQLLKLNKAITTQIKAVPSADVIPVLWIEEQIKRLTEMDNGFAHLAAGNISSLLKTWREKDDE